MVDVNKLKQRIDYIEGFKESDEHKVMSGACYKGTKEEREKASEALRKKTASLKRRRYFRYGSI